MIGKAIAGEAKATFFYISASSLTSKWVCDSCCTSLLFFWFLCQILPKQSKNHSQRSDYILSCLHKTRQSTTVSIHDVHSLSKNALKFRNKFSYVQSYATFYVSFETSSSQSGLPKRKTMERLFTWMMELCCYAFFNSSLAKVDVYFIIKTQKIKRDYLWNLESLANPVHSGCIFWQGCSILFIGSIF